jgi:hypothetical protein
VIAETGAAPCGYASPITVRPSCVILVGHAPMRLSSIRASACPAGEALAGWRRRLASHLLAPGAGGGARELAALGRPPEAGVVDATRAAPLAMPNRIAMGVAGWWEPILAVVLTLAAIAAPVQLGGRATPGPPSTPAPTRVA